MISELLIAQSEKIQNNPFFLSGDLYPLIDNGYGGLIEDYSDTPAPISYTNPVRISTVKKQIKQNKTDSSPYVTVEKHIMISDKNTIVDLRLEFFYNGLKLKVMTREKLIKFGEIFGYQYELNNITQENFNE